MYPTWVWPQDVSRVDAASGPWTSGAPSGTSRSGDGPSGAATVGVRRCCRDGERRHRGDRDHQRGSAVDPPAASGALLGLFDQRLAGVVPGGLARPAAVGVERQRSFGTSSLSC